MPDLRRSARFRVLTAAFALATLGSVATASLPSAAQGVGVPEIMYSDDAYLAQRVVEVTDTSDVTLGVEWSPTVDGFVTHITFCLDVPINSRIPVWATLWTADGTRLGAVGGGSEGVPRPPPDGELGELGLPDQPGVHPVRPLRS